MSSIFEKYKRHLGLPFHRTFISLLVILVTLFVDSGGNPELSFVALLGVILVLIGASRYEFLYIIMFLSINYEIMYYKGVPLFVVIWLFYCLKFLPRTRIIFSILWIVLVLAIYRLLVGVFIYNSGVFSAIAPVFKLLLVVVVFVDILVKSNLPVTQIWNTSIYYLALGLVSSSIISFVISPNRMGRFSVVISKNMSNDLAIAAGFATGCIMLILQSRVGHKRFHWWILLVFTIGIGMMTLSRTYFMMFIISVFWVLLASFNFSRNRSHAVLLFLLLGALMGSPYFLQEQSLFRAMISRFNTSAGQNIVSGRDLIWEVYADHFRSGLRTAIFGMFDSKLFGVEMMAHNAWIELWALYGLVGMLLVAILGFIVVRFFSRFMKSQEYALSIYGFLPLFLYLAAAWYSHNIVGNIRTFSLLLAFISLYLFQPRRIGHGWPIVSN